MSSVWEVIVEDDREIMDNFALNVRAVTRKSLVRALGIACAASSGRVSHWCETPKYGLVLFWYSEKTTSDLFQGKAIHPLPSEMSSQEAVRFAWKWLQEADRSKFKLTKDDARYEDSDVGNDPAWRVFVEEWGYVGGSHNAIAAILPCWAWLGK